MLLLFPVDGNAWYAGYLNTFNNNIHYTIKKSPHGGPGQCAVFVIRTY